MRGTVIANKPCYQILQDGGKPIYCELGSEHEWDRDDTRLPDCLDFKSQRDQKDHDERFAGDKAGLSQEEAAKRDQDLYNAVSDLDPQDSSLWTRDGQPQINAIKEILRESGIPDPDWVSRKEVDRVVGEDFTQGSALASSQTEGGGSVGE